MKENNIEVQLETIEPLCFAELLRQFYACVRNGKGESYSKSGMIGIRAAIQRYMSSPPINRTFNIIADKEFITANKVKFNL